MNSQSRIQLYSGRDMPVLGLGTWELTDDTAGTITDALQLGYCMIDTSGDYGTQQGIGDGIKNSGVSRDQIYLVTKVEENGDAYTATQNNLSELRVDYVDLILIHRPPEPGVGEELWQGLLRAKEDGLAKDIGVSNYSVEQIKVLISATGEKPVVNQIEWTPFGYSKDMLQYCHDNQIVIQAYSPLTRSELLDSQTLIDIANKYNKSSAQILIRWNLQLGTVPIVKANQHAHLQENIDVFDFELVDEDMSTLNGLNEHHSSLGSSPQYV